MHIFISQVSKKYVDLWESQGRQQAAQQLDFVGREWNIRSVSVSVSVSVRARLQKVTNKFLKECWLYHVIYN